MKQLQRSLALLWVGLGVAFSVGCAHRVPTGGPESLPAALRLPSAGPVELRPGMLEGKTVMVKFLATWCFTCLSEIPVLKDLQERYADKGLQIVAVGMDQEGEKVLTPFAQHYGLNFPLLVADQAVRSGETLFGPVQQLPSTVLVDARGKVHAVYSGTAAPKQLENLVKSALPR